MRPKAPHHVNSILQVARTSRELRGVPARTAEKVEAQRALTRANREAERARLLRMVGDTGALSQRALLQLETAAL
jgi:hypothetical protein